MDQKFLQSFFDLGRLCAMLPADDRVTEDFFHALYVVIKDKDGVTHENRV
ncbi:hypothetical protein [Sulfobacillus thermosulfidooxidans]|nr:hypothetical protein [Sulfobacillus thermosulfidooxidans]